MLLTCLLLFSESAKTGNLMGRIIAADTNYPLANVNVIITELEIGAYTNDQGEYRIYDILVGNYSLAFQLIGFKPQLKTDVVIRSNRTSVMSSLTRRNVKIKLTTYGGAKDDKICGKFKPVRTGRIVEND